MVTTSSRRYQEYRREVAAKRSSSAAQHEGEAKKRAARSFGQLLAEFLKLTRGHTRAIAFALATLTVATILRLAPPLATKLVVDNVLIDRPLPAW